MRMLCNHSLDGEAETGRRDIFKCYVQILRHLIVVNGRLTFHDY